MPGLLRFEGAAAGPGAGAGGLADGGRDCDCGSFRRNGIQLGWQVKLMDSPPQSHLLRERCNPEI